MTSKNVSPPSCELASCKICFGVSGLNNPSLLEKFYPEDLPEDWRLSYYSNEFHLLLISLPDLNIPFSSVQEMKAVTPDEIFEALAQLSDELEQDFVLMFDITKLSDNTRYILSDVQKEDAEHCHFINLSNMSKEVQTACSTTLECVFLLLKGTGSHSNGMDKEGNSLLCIVTDEQAIAAVELRQLIAQLRAHAISKQYQSVNILFSSAQNALENCRNAILLESMM